MARQIDTSSLQGFKTLRDVTAGNALTDQKIAAGNVANASAANIYATQQLSAAAASGDQNLYSQTKQKLADMGTDMSGWAEDIETGAKQAQAARLAQSPLGPLINAGLKGEANTIAATSAMGNTAGGASLTPLSQQLSGALSGIIGGGGAAVPRQRPAQTMAAPLPPALPNAMPGQDPQAEFQQRLQGAQAQNGVSPAQDPALAGAAPPAAAPAAPQSKSSFVQPPQNSGETNQAYIQRVNQAFEQWKANPETIKEQKVAENSGSDQGKEIGDASKAMNIMMGNLPALADRINRIKQYAPDASSGLGVDSEGNGLYPKIANSLVGSTATAKANAQLKQLVAQGIFPEINAALGQSNTKGNKFLENIINNASGIQMDSPSSSKIEQADNNLQMFVANMKSTASHLRKLGQPAPSDAEIDAAVASAGAKSQPAQPSASPYQVGQMIDGTDGKYIFMGGDATSPTSYKKVQ